MSLSKYLLHIPSVGVQQLERDEFQIIKYKSPSRSPPPILFASGRSPATENSKTSNNSNKGESGGGENNLSNRMSPGCKQGSRPIARALFASGDLMLLD